MGGDCPSHPAVRAPGAIAPGESSAADAVPTRTTEPARRPAPDEGIARTVPARGTLDVERWARWARASAAILLALSAAQALTRPFFWDQGIFAWVGDAVRAGGMPYRDAWDIKGPLAYLVAALAGSLFGRHEWGIRLVDLAIVYGGAWAVASLARRLSGERSAAWWAGGLFLLWYAALDYANSAQPDGWAAALLAGAMLALLREDRERGPGWRGACAAGVAIGGCALIKPTYGAFLAAALAHLLSTPGRGGRRLGASAALLAGFALPVVACVSWFAARGALGDMLDVYVRYPLQVYAAVDSPWLWRLEGSAEFLLLRQFAIPLPLAIVGWAALLRRDRPAALLVLAWALLAVANVAAQGRFWAYHWLPFYPPLALLTGLGVAAATRALMPPLAAEGRGATSPGSPVAAQVLAAVVGVVALSAAFVPLQIEYRWAKGNASGPGRARYESKEYGADGRQPASVRAVAAYVASRTAPGDRVLFWAQHPGYYYLSGRRPPGRFGFPRPLLQAPTSPAGAAYRREFLASFEAARPAFVARPAAGDCVPAATDREACLSSFPELAAIVARDYVHDSTFALDADSAVRRYEVLRRR